MAEQQGSFFLTNITERITKRSQIQLEKKAQGGSVRALELLWQEVVQDCHGVAAPTWADRERGFIKDLLSRYTDDDISIVMRWAVRNWVSLYKTPGFRLQSLPIFLDFYFQRDRIWAQFKSDQLRQNEVKKITEERRQVEEKMEEWKKAPKPERSLMDLFKEARVEARKEREAKGWS